MKKWKLNVKKNVILSKLINKIKSLYLLTIKNFLNLIRSKIIITFFKIKRSISLYFSKYLCFNIDEIKQSRICQSIMSPSRICQSKLNDSRINKLSKNLSKKLKIIIVSSLVIFIISIFIPTRCFKVVFSSNFDVLNNLSLILNKDPIKVHMIDINQGDATLIEIKDFIILVDTGPLDGKEKLINYVKSITDKIDLFIITHDHDDHYSNMFDVINNFKVSKVFLPIDTESDLIKDFKEELIKRKIDFSVPFKNSKINLQSRGNDGDKETVELNNFNKELKINILNPNGKDFENLNNSSIVFSIDYKNMSFLFLGDLELDNMELTKKHYDFIKAGHHGSKTSLNYDFISSFTPSFIGISCGFRNEFNHPSYEVIDILDKTRTKYLRTDFNGSIVITSDGHRILYN